MNKFKDMDRCPNCGEELISNAIDVGVGYVYEPLHCDNCMWCEGCNDIEIYKTYSTDNVVLSLKE